MGSLFSPFYLHYFDIFLYPTTSISGDFKSVGQRLISQKKKEKVVSMLVHEGMW